MRSYILWPHSGPVIVRSLYWTSKSKMAFISQDLLTVSIFSFCSWDLSEKVDATQIYSARHELNWRSVIVNMINLKFLAVNPTQLDIYLTKVTFHLPDEVHVRVCMHLNLLLPSNTDLTSLREEVLACQPFLMKPHTFAPSPPGPVWSEAAWWKSWVHFLQNPLLLLLTLTSTALNPAHLLFVVFLPVTLGFF